VDNSNPLQELPPNDQSNNGDIYQVIEEPLPNAEAMFK
jgi:hypothetical protein